jgi:hypothetical protein
MGKQKPPAFKFYYRDWLHAVRRFSPEEKVEYLEMLFEQADSITGSIPEDIFAEVTSEKIRSKFEKDSNGFFNVRMRDILLERDAYSERQRAKSNKRWNKEPGESHGNPTGNPLENEVEKEVEKEVVKGSKKTQLKKVETKPLVFPFTDEVFLNRWEAWKTYKREQFKFSYKHSGEQAALKNLGEISNGNMEVALAIIQRSMANGWKGLFNLDNANEPRTPAEAEDYMARVRKSMNK